MAQSDRNMIWQGDCVGAFMVSAMSYLFRRRDLLGDSEAFAGALETLAVFVALGMRMISRLSASMVSCRRSTSSKHDADYSGLIFDLDADLGAHVFPLCYLWQTNRAERRTQIRA